MIAINKKIKISILTIFISSCVFADEDSLVCKPDSTVFNDILDFRHKSKNVQFI